MEGARHCATAQRREGETLAGAPAGCRTVYRSDLTFTSHSATWLQVGDRCEGRTPTPLSHSKPALKATVMRDPTVSVFVVALKEG